MKTFIELVRVEKELNRLFARRVSLYIRQNDQKITQDQYEKMAAKNDAKIEKLMVEYFPKVKYSYPGLYPSFSLNGFQFHDVISLINELYTIKLRTL